MPYFLADILEQEKEEADSDMESWYSDSGPEAV